MHRGLLLLALVLVPSAGRAQSPVAAPAVTSPSSGTRPTSCVDRVADSALVTAVLYLHPPEPAQLDAATAARMRDIDLFAQLVADRLRGMLPQTAGVLPQAEPAMTWRTREVSLHVVVDREGHFTGTSTYKIDHLPLDPREARPHPLASVLDSLRADGEIFLFTAGPPDSVAFDLGLSEVGVKPDGTLESAHSHLAVPIATLKVPRITEARLLRITPPRYPSHENSANVEAVVVMNFVVDTLGHADPATIRDVLDPRTPIAWEFKSAYDNFLEAVRGAVRSAVFEPARIGGCPIRQGVQQPFIFGKKR